MRVMNNESSETSGTGDVKKMGRIIVVFSMLKIQSTGFGGSQS